ncbi:MAG: YkgJ family cysteine cluster protein [Deltaproteobacteria bacterium]|nr:YkgJ family cysteine cluster protein [Deltaproteobacteria bacterium]
METTEQIQRLTADDTFTFLCHKGVKCFTHCCRDLDIVLTPYDIIRLKLRLGISSGEFLTKYTTSHIGPQSGLPIVNLKMENNAKRNCSFVTAEGCAVYSDRPGACRSYPLGRVAVRRGETQEQEEFFVLVREPHCLGFNEGREWKAKDWVKDQEIDTYNKMNDLLMEVISTKNRSGNQPLSKSHQEIFYTACYDIDKFRKVVSEESFAGTYCIEPAVIEKVKADEIALMQFSLRWLAKRLMIED